MNTVIRALTGLLLIFTLAACATSTGTLTTDVENVAAAAAAIADFDLPDGYSADFSATLMGYTLVSFRPDDEHSHLYLIQSEHAADRQKLEQMLGELAPGSSDPKSRVTVVETRPITVRGGESSLVISEGINSEGSSYRQATVAFEGKGGPALLVISRPAAQWDSQMVDTFIASIR